MDKRMIPDLPPIEWDRPTINVDFTKYPENFTLWYVDNETGLIKRCFSQPDIIVEEQYAN
jgi:hypothetical protein